MTALLQTRLLLALVRSFRCRPWVYSNSNSDCETKSKWDKLVEYVMALWEKIKSSGLKLYSGHSSLFMTDLKQGDILDCTRSILIVDNSSYAVETRITPKSDR